MIRASWAAAAAGVLALSAGGARADDVVRLNGTGDAPALTLGYNGQSETQLVRHGYGGYGGFRGGYGGFHGGFRGGYGGFHGGYGGFRGFGGYHGYGFHGYGFRSFYRPYFHRSYFAGFGFHRAFYRPYWGWGGFGLGGLYGGYSGYPGYGAYGYGYPSYGYGGYGYGYPLYGGYGGYGGYGYPSYGGYGGYAPYYYGGGYGGYCYPMSSSVTLIAPSTCVNPDSTVPDMPPAGTPAVPQQGGAYSYDGGPSNPVPLPGADQPAPAQPAPVQPAPTTAPRRVIPQPASGLLVSIPEGPRPSTGFAYPAYGEGNRATSFATDRIRRTGGR